MSNSNNSVFSNNLKHYMEINNKSRYDLVNDLGFKYSTVCEWISGKKIPRMDKIQALSLYFNISLSDLLEEKSAPANDSRSEKINRIIKEISDLDELGLDMIINVVVWVKAQRNGK